MNWGLLLIGAIQIATAGLAVFGGRQGPVAGIATLPPEFSFYRHLLVALWISVGTIYCLSAFQRGWWTPAVVLALCNAMAESTAYWLAWRSGKAPLWYAWAGSLAMVGAAFLALAFLLCAPAAFG